MGESAASPRNDPPASSIPDGVAPLESILCTEELQNRSSRPANYEKENNALRTLVSALADSPSTIFQTLAETIKDITQSDSAGLSLLTRDGKTPDVGGQRFYWPAITGMWSPHVGGGTPREFRPLWRRARFQSDIVVPTFRTALSLSGTSQPCGRGVPHGAVLRRRASSWDYLGDHAQ